MKKLLAATLALALLLALAVPALAADYGEIDDINFDGKFEIEFPLGELMDMAREAGADDTFTLDDLQFKVTLGSDYVKLTKKAYDDTVTLEPESSESESSEGETPAALLAAAEPAVIKGKGIRVTLTPVDDHTVADREVRFEFYFLRSHSGKVVKTEAVKGRFNIVRRDIPKGEIGVLAGENAPVRLEAETDIISASRFSEGAGKSIKLLAPDELWQLYIKNISSEQNGINVTYNTVADDNVTESFPKAKFQCVNFLSPNARLATRAELSINVDADGLGLKGPEQRVWLYSFDGKNLTLEGTETVNVYEHDLTVTFDVNGKSALGSYYISDTELAGTAAPESSASQSESGSGSGNAANPNTGAADYVGVAVTLAVIALTAAAAISISGKSGR